MAQLQGLYLEEVKIEDLRKGRREEEYKNQWFSANFTIVFVCGRRREEIKFKDLSFYYQDGAHFPAIDPDKYIFEVRLRIGKKIGGMILTDLDSKRIFMFDVDREIETAMLSAIKGM